MSRRGLALFVAMCVVWGIPYLFIKVAVGGVEPPVLVFLRTSIGALLLLPIAAQRREIVGLFRHWRMLVLFTIVEVGVPWLLLSDAERTLSSSLTALLVATVPIIGVVIARLGGGQERFKGRQLLGLLIGLAGVATLVGFDVKGTSLRAAGELAIVAVGYAIGPLIIARGLRSLPPIGVICASLVLTSAAYAPIALVHLPSAMPSPSVVASILVLAVVCTAGAFVLFFALIAEVGPVRATVITYVNPAVAVLLGVIVLGEPFTPSIGAGFALILTGCFLATRRPRELRAVPAPAA